MERRSWFTCRWPLLMLLAALIALPALSDDGPMIRKQVQKTPGLESEKAQLSMFQFFVPATKANGELTTISYYADRDGDNQGDELIETRDYAKPLLATFYDEADPNATRSRLSVNSGTEVGVEIRRDAWASISFDDGETWKQFNLSESALESSFEIDVRDAQGNVVATNVPFPGDVGEVLHAIAGNKILVVWTSKYCSQGSPRYSVKDELDADGDGDTEEPLYEDLFDVAGSQKSIDYYDWMHHGDYPFREVGEIPFSCVWTARGTIEQVVNPQTGTLQWGIQWRKPERLTSGKRDAFYLAIDGVEGAGFAVAWQEDPEGLRPGYGEGPGIGWSGSTVNHKTDIWYSSISWNDFAAVDTSDQDPETNKPKVLTQMSMPIRISDNYNCLSDRVDQDGIPHPGFCYADWNLNGTPDLCASSMAWTNSKGEVKNICVTEDGRLLNGQTGSSRARMSLEGYTNSLGQKSAWVILAYEETKGLGAGHTDLDPLDIGKDVMYHSFDMFKPQKAAPGTMLNLPETDPLSSPDSPTLLPLLLNDKGEYQYQSAIGRRPSLVVQPSATVRAGRTSAIVLYKDGSERQGGPSDVFMRRFVVPSGFNPRTDNPYDIRNLVCEAADFGIVTSSPSAYPASAYPNGLCVRGAVNVSGTTPLTFQPLDNDADGLPSHGITQRVLTWEQTPDNLDDESWVNKYDVAKGHRGFLDGNFLMIMYAHSPNWLATSHGKEPYNLYIRRSFDGGLTWTTTPASLGGDGTTYDQVLGVGDRVWSLTRTLAAGEFEPARNVSQMTSSSDTVLDPRYSPTNIGTQQPVTRLLQPDGTYTSFTLYPDDAIRDPSRFFAVYETGDASVVLTGGEADPLDLFYSRATNYGDDWDTIDAFAQGKGLWEERWDWLENKDAYSGEASMAASPGGDFMYVIWNQWDQDASGHPYNSDPIYRRLWWDDESEVVANAGTYTAVAGQVVTLTGNAAYVTSRSSRLTALAATAFDYTWDLDMDGVFETAGQTAQLIATGSMQGAALRVCDGAGNCDIDQGWINPQTHTPRVWRVQTTPNAAPAGTVVQLAARFTDPGVGDSHTAAIDWGDGIVQPATTTEDVDGKGSALVVGSHAYARAGFYVVKVTVTDNDGHSGWDYLRYAVIFDRANGNVDASDTQFNDPNGGGTADLTFTAKYKKDALIPEGKIKFKIGKSLAFEGEGHEWYVARTGGEVFIQGTNGTFNGQSGYSYLISAAIGNPDLVRVKLWKRNGLNRIVVYDSQPGADDLARPAATLTKGKIKLEF